jgi:hypothetical protein
MQGMGSGQALLLLDSLMHRILSTLAPSLISRYLTPGPKPHIYAGAVSPRTSNTTSVQRRMTGQVTGGAMQAVTAAAATAASADAPAVPCVPATTPSGTVSSTSHSSGGQKSEKPAQRIRDELTEEVRCVV